MEDNKYEYIQNNEEGFQKPVELEEGWWWSMKEHLRLSYLYKHSQFDQNNDDRDLRPFKNIVLPILNISYRTEGFDVKDIEIYVNNPDLYYKSFLVRKYHEKWALENEVDTFIDQVVESFVDYGGVLVKEADKPEVVDLRTLVFANQKDLMAYPFCIKHTMSASEIQDMKGWGEESNGATHDVEAFLQLAKDDDEIDIYELHGVLPGDWINEDKPTQQMQIVAFYKDQEQQEVGVTLYAKKTKQLFKFLKRDPISNRALGWGGIEELFESQAWTNFDEIKITEMLESASKILFKSDDSSFKSRNNLRNVDNLEVLQLKGGDINQLDTYPRNLAVFNDSLTRWEEHARTVGSASEGMLGESPSSGTPFKLFEAQQIEARGMHHYRQGRIAVFMDEIYRDWFIPEMAKEIVNEQRFLSELSADELQELVENVVTKERNKFVKEKILNSEEINPEEVEALKVSSREGFLKSNRKFVEILKDEFKETELGILTNIAGKQKNLALLTDKLVNVLRQFISTPEIRQDPGMVKLLNTILESSGMSPMTFASAPQQLQQAQPAQGGTEALKALGQTQLKQQQNVGT